MKFHLCHNMEQCEKIQLLYFEKGYSWGGGVPGVLEFDDNHFPFYILIEYSKLRPNHLYWSSIVGVEADPNLKKQLRKQKIEKLNECR